MKIIPYFPRPALCLLATALVLSACASPPRVSVKDQWSTTLSSYGLIPIYPLREDVFVGDLRLAVKDSGRFELGYLNLGYIDLTDELETYNGGRMALPATKNVGCHAAAEGAEGDQKPEASQPGACWAQPTASQSLYSGESGDANKNRLRLAALPDVAIVNVRGGDLGVGGPLGGAVAALGLAGQSGENLSIKLRAIETMEVPLSAVYSKLEGSCGEDSLPELTSDSLLKFGRGQFPLKEGETAVNERLRLLMITRVFYARSIEYSLSLSDEAAANLSAALSIDGIAASLPDQSGVDSKREVVDPDSPVDDARAKKLRDLASSLNSVLGGSASPGLAASSFFISDRGLTLQEVFERPMAFGVQAVKLDPIEPCKDGSIVGDNSEFGDPGEVLGSPDDTF